MILGERLRQIREEKKLSQGDIERKTGLLRCYISRIENGHTIPAVDTLEKLARGLEIPLYQLFYDADEKPELPALLQQKDSELDEFGEHGKEARVWQRLCALLGRMEPGNRNLLLSVAQRMAAKGGS